MKAVKFILFILIYIIGINCANATWVNNKDDFLRFLNEESQDYYSELLELYLKDDFKNYSDSIKSWGRANFAACVVTYVALEDYNSGKQFMLDPSAPNAGAQKCDKLVKGEKDSEFLSILGGAKFVRKN